MTLRPVEADLNARSRNGWVRIDAGRIDSAAVRGDEIVVLDTAEGIAGSARLAEVDIQNGLAYLEVDWNSFHELPESRHASKARVSAQS